MFRAPFQNPGTSKGLKKCLNAKRRGLKELRIIKPSGRALVSGSYIVTDFPFG